MSKPCSDCTYFARLSCPSNFTGAKNLRMVVLRADALRRPAHQRHLGDWLEMHILRPHQAY